MYLQSAIEEYGKALKLGQKEYKELSAAGQSPYPAVLDELLPDGVQYTTIQLPVQEIPIQRVVGVKTAGRISAFTRSFLPLLDPESEFAGKWMSLYAAQVSDEGIRDPILCYEYLGDFYVQEGNKRVSVLRYAGAAKLSATVYRVMPSVLDTPRLTAYGEFLEFYKSTELYDVQFTRPGDYAKLLSYLGKEPGEVWSQQERRTFSAYYHYFREAFNALEGGKSGMRPEEALLLWLQVYPFRQLGELSDKDLKKTLAGLWKDVVASSGEEPVKLQTSVPEPEAKGLLDKLLPTGPDHLNVAFIHQRDPEESTWTQGHDRGREYLEQALGDAVTVRSYFHADTPEQAEAALEQAVAEGAQVIFTTTPQLLRPTLKAAVKYPKVRFLNCSADTPLSSVRSYYCRIFEGKFITGAIAGALAENDLVGYIGTYPILGVPAAINAFALGAQMTNPRARILLEWSCLPGNPTQLLLDRGVRVISNRDIPVRDRQYLEFGQFGTFAIELDGTPVPLASPCWMWGKLYENVVRSILAGTWKKTAPEAVNYWWGMDSGVIDVELSDRVPESLRALAGLLARDIQSGKLDPFRRRIVAQDGSVKNEGGEGFPPEALLHMDWLCENVEGHIPEYGEVLPISQALVRELGLHRERVPQEKEAGM